MNATPKTATHTVPPSERVIELREKIQNPEYLDFAVQRIAQVLSRQLVEEDFPSPAKGKL